MCGRYQLYYDVDLLAGIFDSQNSLDDYEVKDEIFPTDRVPIVIRRSTQNYMVGARWGFKNHYNNRPLINVRGETVDEKKTFKNIFLSGRCIVPATAFFEWRKNHDGSKTKMKITVTNSPVFGMAGLYRTELDEKGNQVLKCAIITTSANKIMSSIHDRMPVILPMNTKDIWLDNTIKDVNLLKGLLIPYRDEITITNV